MSKVKFVNIHEYRLPIEPMTWLTRLRGWLIEKLGGDDPWKKIKVARIPVDGDTVIKRLIKQRRDLTDKFRQEPMEIWMGAEDYEELMGSPTIRQYMNVQSSFNWGRHQVLGLTVHVIPWMDGAIVMPALFRRNTDTTKP